MLRNRRELNSTGAGCETSNDGLPLSISRSALLIDGHDREFRRLIHRMILTESRLVEVRKAIAGQVGVSGPQYTMLMAVLHLEGDAGISIGALANHLEVTGPHVTGEIRKLLAQGLVRKSMNPNDKRGVLVSLSGEGNRRLLRAFNFIRNVNDILFDNVTAEEFRILVKFNGKFMRNTGLALDWTDRMSRPIRRNAIR